MGVELGLGCRCGSRFFGWGRFLCWRSSGLFGGCCCGFGCRCCRLLHGRSSFGRRGRFLDRCGFWGGWLGWCRGLLRRRGCFLCRCGSRFHSRLLDWGRWFGHRCSLLGWCSCFHSCSCFFGWRSDLGRCRSLLCRRCSGFGCCCLFGNGCRCLGGGGFLHGCGRLLHGFTLRSGCSFFCCGHVVISRSGLQRTFQCGLWGH